LNRALAQPPDAARELDDHGGPYDHLIGKELGSGSWSWDRDKAQLYAVGVGAGLDDR